MAGYTRQSVADILNGLEVTAPPINKELNQLASAFDGSTGHSHDGTTGNSPKIDLTTSVDGYLPAVHGGVGGLNKTDATTNPSVTNDGTQGYAPGSLWLNTTTDRVFVCMDNATGAAIWHLVAAITENNVFFPETNDTVDIGLAGQRFKDLYLSGAATIGGNTSVGGNLTVTGTSNVSGLSTLASVDINGGNVDGTVIGAASPTTITGTNITSTTGFSGDLTGNVAGNVTGNVTGDLTGNVTGDLTGNVTSSGTSTFSTVTITGTLNMDTGTVGTITGLSTPVNTTDAATKGYVDTTVNAVIDAAPGALDTLNELAAALGDDPNFSTTITNSIATKLPLAGGTMTGGIAMGGFKVSDLGTPAVSGDATTKSYVDAADNTKLNLTGGTLTGNLVMGANKVTTTADPTAAEDLARKAYVDSILGSATSAADSAAAASTSETNAAASASAASTSETNAAASASAAATSETNAATSETNAANSASAAATSETNAATSETNAAASASAAATSETNSATSETNAANSASAAATSETNAATSETNAVSSASAASTSETNAASSAAAAAASFDSFDDRYLGAFATDPTTDNDGNALLTGAIYWNTSSNSLFVWSGSAWLAAAFDAAGAMFGVNNLSDVQDPAVSRTNLGLGTAAIQNTSYFATAAQGSKADTAQQPPSEGAFIDGDKTKLDGIETGATADQTGAEIKSLYEAQLNTNAYTDAEKSKLDGIEANADVTDAINVQAAGALMDSEVTNLAQVKAFNSADYATAAQGSLADTALQPDSPALTGTPTAPTAAPETNTTQIATTAFVEAVKVALRDGVDPSLNTFQKLVTAFTAEVALKANKANPVFTGNATVQEEIQAAAYIETVVALSGTSVTVDCDEANNFTLTTGGNTTFTFDYSGVNLTTNDSYGFTLKVTAGGSHTLSWPASVDWPVGTAPDAPASGETDVFVFYTVDGGTTWYGFQAGDALA